jgi:hypothetical protein
MEGAIADALDWILMDACSSQLENPPAWLHIDNQVTRTTDLTQTEGGNASDEYESRNLMRESLSDESAMEVSGASEAADRSIAYSSDDSLSGSDSNSLRALNIPRTDQSRVQLVGDEATSSTLQRPANRPEEYRCGCGLPLRHVGLCRFNSTEAARLEVLEGVVVQPMPFVSEADIHRLLELHAAGNGASQDQDEGYMCWNCGPVTRPHACPFKRCPICGRRRRDHNNNTFCRN